MTTSNSDVGLPWSAKKPARPAYDPLNGIKPKLYRVHGGTRAFFSVGQLGKVLNRKAVTMRAWERDGILPRPSYRYPGRDPRGARRLYTRAQVLAIYQIAAEEGILDPHARAIKDTRFTARVIEMFSKTKDMP